MGLIYKAETQIDFNKSSEARIERIQKELAMKIISEMKFEDFQKVFEIYNDIAEKRTLVELVINE